MHLFITVINCHGCSKVISSVPKNLSSRMEEIFILLFFIFSSLVCVLACVVNLGIFCELIHVELKRTYYHVHPRRSIEDDLGETV